MSMRFLNSIFTIDMALYDIIGKAQNRPVYEVLGGAYRTEFEMLTNLYEDSPEEKAKACQEYVKKGFRGLKIKVGDILLTEGWSMQNLKKEKDKLIAALEAVPSDIYIDTDANQSWGNAKIALNIVEDLLRDKYYPITKENNYDEKSCRHIEENRKR